MEKPRLFIDMDGTLTEWRNIIFSAKIKRQEDVTKAIEKLNKILLTPGYFKSLLPHENVVDSIKDLFDTFDIYILTCAMNLDDPTGPAFEKRWWKNNYLPMIPDDHMIIIPNGANKTEYIPGGIRQSDLLLDDYTKNLKEWTLAGGKGIKLLNDINEKHGSWRGNAVSMTASPSEIAKAINNIALGQTIRHRSPKKTDEPYIEITEDYEVPGYDV